MTPASVNATVGSTAIFTCSISTGLFGWEINRIPRPELTTTDITTSDDGNTYFLHILATEEHNNTNVTCSVYTRGVGLRESDPAVLRVQGML